MILLCIIVPSTGGDGRRRAVVNVHRYAVSRHYHYNITIRCFKQLQLRDRNREKRVRIVDAECFKHYNMLRRDNKTLVLLILISINNRVNRSTPMFYHTAYNINDNILFR